MAGLSLLVVAGSAIGAVLPKNPTLPTPWYRWVSACVGYTYFLCWSVSFYPQVLTNYRRKTTQGLSPDFCSLNVLGFACYSAYNAALYYSHQVQDQYRARHGLHSQVTVQPNDVAFAFHALTLSVVTLAQIGYYDGFRARHPSRETTAILIGLLLVIAGSPLLVLLGVFEWLDYLYLLSYIKIGITLIKYAPQLILNFQRRSTQGWSIWQILLDFSGGLLSDLQLVFDCVDLHDWTGISGNLAKLVLGLASIAFDALFLLQHYVWFRAGTSHEHGDATAADDTTTALL